MSVNEKITYKPMALEKVQAYVNNIIELFYLVFIHSSLYQYSYIKYHLKLGERLKK